AGIRGSTIAARSSPFARRSFRSRVARASVVRIEERLEHRVRAQQSFPSEAHVRLVGREEPLGAVLIDDPGKRFERIAAKLVREVAALDRSRLELEDELANHALARGRRKRSLPGMLAAFDLVAVRV